MVRRLLTAAVAAILFCGCYDRFDAPQKEIDMPAPNISISALHAFWRGNALTVDEDIIIRGQVTSSDRAGNFYRTFTIVDPTGGAEILAGITDIFNIYPVGSSVDILLNGCAIDEQNGVLQIGLPAESYDYGNLLYLQSKVNLDKHIISSGAVESLSIPVLRYYDLNESLCGAPVTIERLVFTPTEGNSGCWSGYARFEDSNGNAIYTDTSSYADFADEEVPRGEVALTGILQYGTVSREIGKQFILKMRSSEDCSNHN